MPRMPIGEFAGRTGLTPKALRLYDELDLLAPARTDPFTGYRFYDEAQLEPARLIAALRGIGMPLTRIRAVVEAAPGVRATLVESYWRQVEADTRSRRTLVHGIVTRLREEIEMNTENTPRTRVATVVGQGARAIQQDAIRVGMHSWAVADGFHQGVGGATAIGALGDLPLTSADEVDAAFRRAGDAFAGADDEGSTLTVLALTGQNATIGHLGDSRVSLLRDGELRALTRDHTEVAALVESGSLTTEEARLHPRRAMLNRALGSGLAADPDLSVVPVRSGDRFVLTTDGVHALFSSAELCALLDGDADEAAGAITAAVESAGAPDNYAAIIVDVL
ncbi:MerR family transcriptional regulator [Microbacterium gorillae]|uniref:MerR family transcriptional regulator n=1 Tax=Microbacterium gorillae TaxID=1231063 RepID=UPI00058B7F6E|nr:MerR family transcriptional regulator [Microbacterium gorillae]